MAIFNGITIVAVFFEGIVSFFSPCIIPLLPVYLTYMMGDQADSKKRYLHTACFIAGVSVVFFILGFSFSAIAKFFSAYQSYFVRIGALVIILLGLFQVGFFDSEFLEKEYRFSPKKEHSGTAFGAFLLGLALSFGWSPCVGPALASVLIMASTAANQAQGAFLILIYALGFLIPFLALTFLSDRLLAFLKEKKVHMQKVVKAGGVVLCLLGVMLFFGWNSFASYISSPTTTGQAPSIQTEQQDREKEPPKIVAPAFTLSSADGMTYQLEDQAGKTIFLNFWASWCGPCKSELPGIQNTYEKLGSNQGDVCVLTIVAPNQFGEKTEEELQAFLKENGYTFPVLFDQTGEVFQAYNVQSFPTSYFIDDELNVFGRIQGALSEQMMQSAVEETKQGW